ncbi:MAG: trypsin-like serine protease [Phycisphaeraceae bacterium]|nr:trypsin-like serine protease [Phycisphaeraceae bacterium]
MNRSSRFLCWPALIALTCAFLASPCAAVNNGVEPHCADRRYDGVGILLKVNNPTVACSQNVSGSCVLIDENTVLVARHSIVPSSTSVLPAAGSRAFKVRFRRSPTGAFRNSYFVNFNNACHGQYTEVFVHEFFRPANINMDVLLARLETPVPWITPIPAETTTTAMPATGHEIKIAGWGYSGPCFRSGSALTLRVATGILPTQNSTSCCIFLNPCSSPVNTGECYTCPPGGPWAIPNFLDSGAPVIVERPCPQRPNEPPQLRVVGIVTTTTNAWKLSEWNRNGTETPIDAPPPVCGARVGDYDGNGTIDLNDLIEYLQLWLNSGCAADLDQSGTVDLADLLIFLHSFQSF